MKRILVLIALTVICGCNSNSGLPPLDAEINTANAAEITAYENTPESVVMYFYASRIRQDNAWEEVCIPAAERGPKFENGLEKYATWKFESCRFVCKEEFRPNAWWVTIDMQINFNGDVEGGEDEATVEMINGKYLITEVPT